MINQIQKICAVTLTICSVATLTSGFNNSATAQEPGLNSQKLTLSRQLLKAQTQDNYAAIWDKSPSTAWVARHGMSSAQYQAEFDKFVGEGYRLVQVSGYSVNNQDRYAAIWDKSPSTAWVARHGMSSAQYQAEFNKFVGQGYRLAQVSGYKVNGQDRYAAIWNKAGGTSWVARHGLTSRQYQAEFDKYVSQGHRLIQVSGY